MVEHEGQMYYTSREVCDLIGYTRSTLMKRVQGGKVRQTKVKGMALYHKEEIEQLMGSEDHMLYGNKSVKLTAKDLSALFDVTSKTIYRWVKEGKIQGEKSGRYWIFTEENLESILSDLNERCKERGNIVNTIYRVI